MGRLRYNGLSTTLGGSLTSSATAVTFGTALTHSGGVNVPTISGGDYVPLTILDATGKASEIVYLTAYTSAATSGTITRGQEGTSGVSHASGDKVVHGPTVTDFGRDYRWFVPAGVTSIDEFNDDTIDAAWARVDGTGAPVGNANWTEGGDSLGVTNAGGDTAAMHAILRPIGTAMSPGDAFITALHNFGPPFTNYSIPGLILADGNTFGAGKQIISRSYLDNTGVAGAQKNDTVAFTNFTTSGGASSQLLTPAGVLTYLRVVMTAANTWRTDVSTNGVIWRIGAPLASTITPTHAGLFASSSGSATKFEAAFEFLRRVSGVS